MNMLKSVSKLVAEVADMVARISMEEALMIENVVVVDVRSIHSGIDDMLPVVGS